MLVVLLCVRLGWYCGVVCLMFVGLVGGFVVVLFWFGLGCCVVLLLLCVGVGLIGFLDDLVCIG